MLLLRVRRMIDRNPLFVHRMHTELKRIHKNVGCAIHIKIAYIIV